MYVSVRPSWASSWPSWASLNHSAQTLCYFYYYYYIIIVSVFYYYLLQPKCSLGDQDGQNEAKDGQDGQDDQDGLIDLGLVVYYVNCYNICNN